MDPLRRRLLQALGLSAGWLLGCGPDGEPSSAFPLGVATGDPTPDGVLLWTRYLGTEPLALEVYLDQQPVRTQTVFPGPGGFVEVELTGLPSFTLHQFRFVEQGGGQWAEGRFKTAPADTDAPPLVFGATSCINHRHSMAALGRAAERLDLDAFFLLGDAAYVDGARTLEEYRAYWARTLRLPQYRALRGAHAIISTWDDHEVVNNWTQETIQAAQFATAAQAYAEHFPRRREAAHPTRLWRKLRYGRTAEVFVLDARGERRPSTRRSAQAQYLSPEQLEWLKRGLGESPATFKLILNSVPISEFKGALYEMFADDRWEGYPAQRTEILQFIEDQGIAGVVWLAGDFHLACMGRVSSTGPGQRAIEVLVGPAAQAPNPAPSYPGPPQFDWSSSINNYAALHLDPTSGEVRVVFHDGANRVIADRRYLLEP